MEGDANYREFQLWGRLRAIAELGELGLGILRRRGV